MSNKAIHQLPAVSDQDATDLLHIARDNSGTYVDRSIRRDLVAQQVYTYTTQIQSADILTMFTTPVKITPAIDAKILIPLLVLITETGSTTDYVLASFLAVGSDSTLSDSAYHATLTGPQTSLGQERVFGTSGVFGTTAAVRAGDALFMKATSANPTTGDGDWLVRTYYIALDA